MGSADSSRIHQGIADLKRACENQERLDRVLMEFERIKFAIENAAAPCCRVASILPAMEITQSYNSFFELARTHGLTPTWNAIDHLLTQRNNRDHRRSDDEANSDYTLAQSIVEAGLQDTIPVSLICKIHSDKHLQPALRYVGILIQILAGRQGICTLALSIPEALQTAKWLHDFFAEHEISVNVLFELHLKMNRLGKALEQFQIRDLPRLNLRTDNTKRKLQTMETVIERLSGLTGTARENSMTNSIVGCSLTQLAAKVALPVDYLKQIQAIEEQWHRQIASATNARVIGASLWDSNLPQLLEIQKRHGIGPNDARAYSVSAFIIERECIERDWEDCCAANGWQEINSNSPEFAVFWRVQARFWARLDDCRSRHFPGLNQGQIDAIPKFWASLVLDSIPALELVTMVDSLEGAERSHLSSQSMRTIYGRMNELKISWTPPPPYKAFTLQQELEELRRIANRLEQDETGDVPVHSKSVDPRMKGLIARMNNAIASRSSSSDAILAQILEEIRRWPVQIQEMVQSLFAERGMQRHSSLVKREGGRPSLIECQDEESRCRVLAYDRIGRELNAGRNPAEIVASLREDKDFNDMLKPQGIEMNKKLVEAARKHFRRNPHRGRNLN
jgi:hypothetical protein